MSRFEFNTVLVAIILAFAVSEILTGWGRLIRDRQRITSPWLYVLASSWVLLAMFMHWYGLWAYQDTPFDRVFHSVAVALPTLAIALACFVWVPDVPESGRFDVEAHYFSTSKWVLPLIAAFSLLSSVVDRTVPGVTFGPPPSQLAVPVVLLALLLTRKAAIHAVVFAALWVTTVALMLLESPS